jgi:hypothetical protein
MLALETTITRNYMIVLLTKYCAGDKSRRMRWARHVARMGEEKGVYRVLGGETKGKETTGET